MNSSLTLVIPPGVLEEVYAFLQAAAIFQEHTAALAPLTATQAAWLQLDANRQVAMTHAIAVFGEDNGRILLQAAAEIIKTGDIQQLNEKILEPLRTSPNTLGKVKQLSWWDWTKSLFVENKTDSLSPKKIQEQAHKLADALAGMFFDFGQFKQAAEHPDNQSVMAGTPMDYVIYPSVLAAKISNAWNIGTKRLSAMGVVAATEQFDNPPQNPLELIKLKSKASRALAGKATDLAHALSSTSSENIDPEFRRNLIERAQRLGFKNIGDAIAGRTQNSGDSSAATTMTPALGTSATPKPTTAPPGRLRLAR